MKKPVKNVLWYLGMCLLLCSAEHPSRAAQKTCSRTECEAFPRDAVHDIIEVLKLKDSDVVVIVDDDASLAQALQEFINVRELTAVIRDQESCDVFEEAVVKSKSSMTRAVCGGLESVDISSATVIIVSSVNVKSSDLLAKIIHLPDGVKVLTRHQLDNHDSIHLEAIQSIPLSALAHVLMYEYVVKRPTVADLLTTMYHGMTGFGISQEEADVVRKAGGDPTYGEIEFPSAEEIFTKLVPVTERDVFYDLGCGIGKLATWIYLATPAKKVVAIELSDTRYNVAMEAKKRMQTTVLAQRKAIMRSEWGERVDRKVFDVIQGDIAEADMADATIIYMCSTCYPDLLMQKMVDKFVTLKEGLRIVTLKELPAHPSLHRVGEPQRFKMSWSLEKGSPVYIYEMHHPRLKDVLDKAYEGIDGFVAPEEEKEEVRKEGGAPTYGEITYESAKVLLRDILKLGPDDVFYDLGSGVGKLVMQAYLESPVRRAVGIELVPTRFDAAEAARAKVEELLTQEPYAQLWERTLKGREKTVEFHLGNITKASLSDATKLFTCATCFSSELMDSITSLCTMLPKGSRIATLKKLGHCSELTLVKTHKLPMTWSNSVEVYEYVVGAFEVDTKKKVVVKTTKRAVKSKKS